MNGRFGFAALVLIGLLCGRATVADACDRLVQASVFAVPQQAVVLSAVPFAQAGFAQQAVVVQSGNCFVPGAVSAQMFGGVRAFGSGVSVAVNGRGFSAAVTGGRRTVVRQGGIRGLFFGNVVRSR